MSLSILFRTFPFLKMATLMSTEASFICWANLEQLRKKGSCFKSSMVMCFSHWQHGCKIIWATPTGNKESLTLMLFCLSNGGTPQLIISWIILWQGWFPSKAEKQAHQEDFILNNLIWNTAFGFTLIYNIASGLNRIDCQKKNRILSENKGHARNFNNNMQDLSPQTKAKTTARISFRDFTDAFNAVGLVLMMSIHILVINCLMHNPDVFAERSVRAPSTEKFKADPTFKNMMRYLIDQILMRRRTVKRSTNDWDCAAYLDEEEEEDTEQRRPSRSKRSLAHPHPKSGQ